MNSRMITKRIFAKAAISVAANLLLSGCLFGENKQFFDSLHGGSVPSVSISSLLDPSPTPEPDIAEATPTPDPLAPSPTPAPTATPDPTPTPASTAMTTESFVGATSAVKKIDFLFVVDNSGSMADNQSKLAAGFESFANTFYRRSDLDICTKIITSDRYLGRTGSHSYQRERTVGCTKPADWGAMTVDQQSAYIDSVIADFKTKVNVGTSGSGAELVGKSIVASIYNLAKWGDAIDTSVRTSFFRSDAVANISIVTDENNWYYTGPSQTETTNDIPAIQNAAIYNSLTGQIDTRKGIKNYLDEFFTLAQSSHGLSYSVSSFLEITKPANTLPGVSMNLYPLTELVGRESARSDIAGNAASYASLYNSIGDALVTRVSAFNVNNAIYEPGLPGVIADLVVSIVTSDDTPVRTILSYGSDYTVLLPNGIVLNNATAAILHAGDYVEVTYRY